MKKIIILVLLTSFVSVSHAQTLTFYSEEMEFGVKMHLGLTENDEVPQSRADTITNINLSGLEISDIRDVVYLPNVRFLDLSGNSIKDISPLCQLDSLFSLNLRDNELESIDMLAFSNVDSMRVNVAYNYISDFSWLFNPGASHFYIVGMDAQSVRNAPYFNIYNFYANVVKGKAVLEYRVYSNMEEPAYLKCLEAQVGAVADGEYHTVDVPGNPQTTEKVFLMNGVYKDSNYVVPPKTYDVAPGSLQTVETGLPEKYQITFLNAVHGNAVLDGNVIRYTAPIYEVSDTLSFTYHDGNVLKGYGLMFMGKTHKPCDVNEDGYVNISDIVAVINQMAGTQTYPNADVNNDGAVNISDVVAIINAIAAGE